MNAPVGIQLRRTKGWRKPPGAIVVSRPSRWGNPLRWDAWDEGGRRAVAEWFAVGLDLRRAGRLPAGNAFHAYPSDDEIRAALRGHDLACWCRVGDPCHRDTLLAIANA